jgi:type II secretory pathway pseudopilin PulG
MISHNKNYKLSTVGDTIVEVIICIAVLGVVMAVAYVSTNHSLQLGTDAGNRNRALGFAQQQLEQVKVDEQTGALDAVKSTAPPGSNFCINPADGSVIKVPAEHDCTICTKDNGTVSKYIDESGGASCDPTDFSLYHIHLSYTDQPAPLTGSIFSSNIKWDAPNGIGFGSLVLYYKAP